MTGTTPVKISRFVAFEASGSAISQPGSDSGYSPDLERELARVGTDGGTVYLDRDALLDLAEWADCMIAPNAQSGNPSGARAMEGLRDRCAELAGPERGQT